MGYLIGDDMALLHPPKTAGLWARAACAAVGLPWVRFGPAEGVDDQHSDAAPPDNRLTMMFVRNPATWLRSLWMYHERTGWKQYSDAPGFIFYANHRDGERFQVFVDRYLDKMPGAIGRMFERYERHAALVGKVENIQSDLRRFIDLKHPEIDTSVILAVTRANTAPPQQRLVSNYAQGQREAVCNAEREFMWRWGY